jgi:nicotinamide-nucleotide amidase
MPVTNRKQADFPRGSTILSNPIGTAEGFSVTIDGCEIFCMPGVPREMRQMLVDEIEPRIAARFELAPTPRRIYRVIGRGESAVAEVLEPMLLDVSRRSKGLAAMFVHYRASMPEVQVILEAIPDEQGNRASEDELRALDRPMMDLLAPALYGVGEAGIAPRVLAALDEAGLSLSTAESCTGGGIARTLTAVPGASSSFLGGIVAYDNRIKVGLLGVSELVLAEHGAVSEAIACAMARGACEATGSDLSVAVTGIAGPTGGTPEKPVGTVHIAVADRDELTHRQLHLRGDRGTVQRAAEQWALKLVWDRLVARGVAKPSDMSEPTDSSPLFSSQSTRQ